MEIGFDKNMNTQTNTTVVPHNFENGICFGQTGSGKTSAFILPNIKDRVENGYSLIVYDFKGTLHSQVKQIAKECGRLDDIVEIGKLWGRDINILKDCSYDTVNEIYNVMYGDASKDPYWLNASRSLFVGLYKIISNLITILNSVDQDSEYAVKNLLKIYNINILSFKTIKTILQDIERLSSFLKQVENLIEQFTLNSYGSINIKKAIKKEKYKKTVILFSELSESLQALSEYFDIENASSSEVGGKFGVLGVVNSIINSVSSIKFLNNEQLDIYKAIDDKKIIIINVSSLDENILALLNISIYSELTKRVSYGNIQPLSIFIDEAQKVLSSHYLPDVDVCRENKFEYILATQDKLLLDSKLSLLKSEELLKNIGTTISFKTREASEFYNTDTLKRFEYIEYGSGKKYHSQPIFFKDEALDLVEQQYLKNQKALYLIIKTKRESCILIHKANLAQNNKTLLKDIKTGETTVIDYIPHNSIAYAKDVLDQYFENSSFGTKKTKKSISQINKNGISELREEFRLFEEAYEDNKKMIMDKISHHDSLIPEIENKVSEVRNIKIQIDTITLLLSKFIKRDNVFMDDKKEKMAGEQILFDEEDDELDFSIYTQEDSKSQLRWPEDSEQLFVIDE